MIDTNQPLNLKILSSNWTFGGKEFTDKQTTGYFGFIYLITNTVTGRKYVGRKYFSKAASKQKNGRKKKIRKESNWKNYYGSSPELLSDIEKYGKDKFTREILYLGKTRGEVNYLEAWTIFTRNALPSEDYYNSWVSARCHAAHLKNLDLPKV